jgi:DNA-binding NtrC family response regulator
MPDKHFLLVDDAGKTIVEQLEIFLEGKNVTIHLVETFDKHSLYQTLDQYPEISVILFDLYGPGEAPERTEKPAGIRLLESIREDDIWQSKYGKKVLPVILTKHGSVKTEYIASAWNLERYIDKEALSLDPEQLLRIWERSQNIRTLELIPLHLRKYELVFHPDSVQMRGILEKIRKVAPFEDTPILIQGETGSGKELVAKAVWEEMKLNQTNATKGMGCLTPFNIASMHPNLLHSQLFGYLKNCYTGARPNGDKGLLQTANEDNATLFLDEIGDVSLDIQVALLRVLQEREIIPLCATKPGFVNSKGELDEGKKLDRLRLIFATHRDLEELVREGKFREDLYYRLNEFTVHVPSLGERKKDIRILAEHFRREFNLRYDMRLDYSDDPHFLNTLESYDWPGNVRELEHDLKRCFIESSENRDGIIEFSDDVREKLTGQKQHGIKNVNNLNIIYHGLPDNPMTLEKLSRLHGDPIALELGKMLIKNLRRLPGEKEAMKYFGMTANAFRRWMHSRKVTLKSLGLKAKSKS